MKTAVSLPDRVYREAEGYAKRTRKSRSQLYAEALAEYLARHAPDEVTEAMNGVVDELGGAAPDVFVGRGERRAGRFPTIRRHAHEKERMSFPPDGFDRVAFAFTQAGSRFSTAIGPLTIRSVPSSATEG